MRKKMKKISLRLLGALLLAPLFWACGQLDLGSESDEKSGEETVPDDGQVLSVSAAQTSDEEGEVTVVGYYVGFVEKTSMSSALFCESIIQPNTNLLLADDALCMYAEDCLPVQLRQGKIREALNTFDHPEMLGQRLLIRGTLTSYFGVKGLKSPTSWKIYAGEGGTIQPDSLNTDERPDSIVPGPERARFPQLRPTAPPVSRGR